MRRILRVTTCIVIFFYKDITNLPYHVYDVLNGRPIDVHYYMTLYLPSTKHPVWSSMLMVSAQFIDGVRE